MADDDLDIEAVRERRDAAEAAFLAACGTFDEGAIAIAAIYPSVWEDTQALLGEVERLRAAQCPFWMQADAETILGAMERGWPVAEWPHEQDAVEKLKRILRLLAGSPASAQEDTK